MMEDQASLQGGQDAASGTCPVTLLEYFEEAFTDVPLEQPV
jgi:hypothetical protein